MMNNLSVIIPVYKSQDSITELYKRLVGTLEGCSNTFEIIFVEDYGRDKSWEIISKLAQNDDRVKGFQHSRNFGQHNALLLGIRKAQKEIVITIDDDLQHPPEEIPKMLIKLAEGFDVVYGYSSSEQHGLWRNLTSQITKLILKNTMGVQAARQVSAFRVFRTKLREAFKNYYNPYVNIDVLLSWGTNRFGTVEMKHDERKFGESRYTFRKLARHAINMITGYSVLPLRIASLAGFGFAVFGFFVLAYVIGRYILEGGVVPGFPFLASIIAIFSGAQLFSIGIIGEYLAKIYFNSMGSPYSVIKDSVGNFADTLEGSD